MAVTLAQHQWIRGMDTVHDALEVDLDHTIPVIQGQLLDQPGDRDSRVVEDQVQPAVISRDLIDEVRDRARVRDVDKRRTGFGAGAGVDLLGYRLCCPLVNVGDHDSATSRRERSYD
jgi:hypothetical protein